MAKCTYCESDYEPKIVPPGITDRPTLLGLVCCYDCMKLYRRTAKNSHKIDADKETKELCKSTLNLFHSFRAALDAGPTRWKARWIYARIEEKKQQEQARLEALEAQTDANNMLKGRLEALERAKAKDEKVAQEELDNLLTAYPEYEEDCNRAFKREQQKKTEQEADRKRRQAEL